MVVTVISLLMEVSVLGYPGTHREIHPDHRVWESKRRLCRSVQEQYQVLGEWTELVSRSGLDDIDNLGMCDV